MLDGASAGAALQRFGGLAHVIVGLTLRLGLNSRHFFASESSRFLAGVERVLPRAGTFAVAVVHEWF
jgi:hypothetical protein